MPILAAGALRVEHDRDGLDRPAGREREKIGKIPDDEGSVVSASRGAGASINRRMTVTVMITTGLSLFLACLSFGIYDVISIRQAMSRQATTLANVIGVNAAATLASDDREAAARAIGALSAATPVTAAVLYDRRGRVFSSYVAASEVERRFELPEMRSPGREFRDDHLELFETIRSAGTPAGTIFIRWNTRELTDTIRWYGAIVLGLLVTMIAVARTLSARLQRDVARPLTELVRGSEAIANGDLSTQVTVTRADEIGVLAQTFNAMSIALRGLVMEVRRSTREVSVVTSLIEDAAGNMSEEAQRQAHAVTETSNSIQQLTHSIQGVNSNVEQLATSAYETSSAIVEMDASIVEVAGHMDDLGRSIDTTSSSVQQVAVNTDQVVKAVENLQIATDGSLTHLEQLTISVQEVKGNAEHSHTLSEDSSQEATKGMTAVRETMDAMHEIATSFEQIQASVSKLDEKSQAIDEILKVIGAVVEQTSMLSLNAAIIAAQAGEQGKAFSVVADEVSNLADRTHRSTREIADLIRAVQVETAAAVAAVTEGSEKVKRGVQRSDVAGSILRQISQKAKNSTERVREIVGATKRQSGDLERVDHAIHEVKEIVEQINHSARDQHRATSEIASAIEVIRPLGIEVRRSTEEQRNGSRMITNAMHRMTEMIHQIAEATKSQAGNSETIQHALQLFGEISEGTTRRANDMNTMVSTLSQRSQKLEREIGRFKTD
jgi:methyl-accepting chemotaxis protein